MLDEYSLHEASPRPPRREPQRDFERTALAMFEEHGRSEGALLESYRQIAERSAVDPAVRYLVGLILEDEKRHHAVFEQMANEIRSFCWEVPVEPSLPMMSAKADPGLLAATKRLLAFEKQDAKELRRLRKHLRDSPASSLDPLMVEMMLLDTAKHIAILEHITSRLT